MNNPNKTKRAFTLVELLVVILIISVLATVVFILASRMKKSAEESVTTANMRQIGIALVSYTVDNGRFPDKSGVSTWDRAIIPNLGYPGTLPGPAGSIKASQVPDLKSVAEVFATPADKEPRTPDTYKRSFAIIPWTCNLKVGNTVRGWKNLPVDKGVPYSTVPFPEKAAMVVMAYYGTDRTSNNLGAGGHAYHDVGGPIDAVGPTQQVLFADGHVEKMKTEWDGKEFRDLYWPGSIQNLN